MKHHKRNLHQNNLHQNPHQTSPHQNPHHTAAHILDSRRKALKDLSILGLAGLGAGFSIEHLQRFSTERFGNLESATLESNSLKSSSLESASQKSSALDSAKLESTATHQDALDSATLDSTTLDSTPLDSATSHEQEYCAGFLISKNMKSIDPSLRKIYSKQYLKDHLPHLYLGLLFIIPLA
ncbi:hypothetical protein BKN38_07960 [Helicobacter sp. CLO-3]|uniref:hypothetical protein n=1 Tax=unclassified Helicobacter TaxID=2593540 RepID=UPI00080495CF|nr:MULTISPECIES: hypothetical protein [unclassified Helicobacter]OBV28667.1 hypothetical protein BA723_08645 [Helicobacter sp. CLO-3]OHU81964.1 hypothetical protein BKN38_07960 [Helicobacter sp. CLO-3]